MKASARTAAGQALAIAGALLLGGCIILAIGESPWRVLQTLTLGAAGDREKIAGTLLQATPIMICGLAACISLRGGLFNVGIEGQLFMGGLAAAVVGFSVALPPLLHVTLGLLAAALAGMAWIALPAFFRMRYNANEVVSTILANYVAVLLTSWLTIFVLKRPGGWSETPPILDSAVLPPIFAFSRLNWGLVIGLLLAVALQLYFRRTASGYAVTTMGSNAKFAEYGGIDIRRHGFRVLLASGAVGGLAGGIEALGVHHRFMEGFAPGFGFDGLIAALLANGHPLGTLATALFFGALRNGSLLLEVDTGASREIITVIQALLILSVSAQILGHGRGDSMAGERRWRF